MTSIVNRKRLFIICILVRACIVYLAYIVTTEHLRLLSIPAFLIGASFIYQLKKKKKIGYFGGKVWWHRGIHAFLWILFAILALMKKRKAYIVLIIDLIIGIISFVHNYYNIK